MFFDHEDQRKVRNPWWCGGEISLRASRENEFWTYRWLNNLFSSIAGFIGIFLTRQGEEESLVSKKHEIIEVGAHSLKKEPAGRAFSHRPEMMDVKEGR